MLKILLFAIGLVVYVFNTRACFEFWLAMLVDPILAVIIAFLWPISTPVVGFMFAMGDFLEWRHQRKGGEW